MLPRIILSLLLAAIAFGVQMFLCKKTENKGIRLIPLFFLLTALVVAFIMSLIAVNSESVNSESIMPIVRTIKDAVTVSMAGAAVATMINKAKN